MAPHKKRDFPVSQVRRFMEPGPVVLVSSASDREKNIMTLGWHMVLGFSPSLIGCYIWDQNHSFGLIRRSTQCVINIPGFGNMAGSALIAGVSGIVGTIWPGTWWVRAGRSAAWRGARR